MAPKAALSQQDLAYRDEIRALKAKWGQELVIQTHHYQRAEVVALNDFVGDSYQLAKNARDAQGARYIVFCGVRFMAEAADVLRRASQVVVHPDPQSGCPLADYAPAEQAEDAWDAIARIRGPEAVMPLVYMNSSAELKAMVGRHGGSVCTSSNAPRAFEWGFGQRQVVFFFPDEHLGRNTANRLGIAPDQVVVWDPTSADGGLEVGAIERARVILWKGYCHVHTHFTVEQIRQARQSHPGCKVVVHPECPVEVVAAADGNGSTSYLVQQAEQAPPGSTLVIGTEINLIARLASGHPDKTILPLARSLCPNMFRISLKKLRDAVASLPDPLEVVRLAEDVKADARLALDRMLSI
jgi:quinolinate synthase